MEYEPTTEGESEDMPDIFQQLLEAAEEEDDDGDDEFHGLMQHKPNTLLVLTPLDAEQGYSTIEVDIGGDDGDATETEDPQDAAAVQARGRLE